MMKSRIVFLCTLAAFLSPVSALAFESTTTIASQHDGKPGCNLEATKKFVQELRDEKNGTVTNTTKSGDAG